MNRRYGPVAALALLVLAAGCSDPVSGTAEQGAAVQVGTPPPIIGALASPMLDRLPANGSSLRDIALVDPVALTQVALRRDYPADKPSGSDRPKSETAWLDQVGVANPCGTALDAPSRGLRTGKPGSSSSLVLVAEKSDADTSSTEKSGTLALCGGALADPAKLLSTDARGDTVAPQTMGGVAGSTVSGVWIGVDAAQSVTYVADGKDIPPDLVQAAISGPAVEPSLAKDARIRAVLDAAPHAAMAEMGTGLVAGSRSSAPAAVRTAFEQAVAQGGYQQPPIPEFGGYAWTPGSRITGTATFVTRYGSAQEAATAGAIITDVWSRLGVSKFSGAVTTQHDVTVVTTLADVGPTEFKVQNGLLPEYPGFLARS